MDWKSMQKFGCLERCMHMVCQIYDGMMARVTDDKAVAKVFAVTNGVKRCCVLASALFSPMLFAMLMDIYLDDRPGIRIAYKNGGQFLNK
ncbi:unnamed protein product [Schistocephalus solidus]|uniref:Reverse transcriptase domain-containing protein n=1 Tax=Schistocephalus solidus TaxID=70667 RepID=A0A183SNR3_SCHSO|nr:unnamed protein product [Schistocephalus solidus]